MHPTARVVVVLALLLAGTGSAQVYRDSLLRVWNDGSLPDTSRLAAAQKLVWRVYLQRSPDTARFYAQEQLKLAEQRGLLKHVSSAYNSIGVTYHIQGDLEEAIQYYGLSLGVDEERSKAMPGDVKAAEGVAASYANLAVLYQEIGDMGLSMEGYDRALHLLDSLEAKGAAVNVKIADVQNNIGMAHETQGNTEDALLWYARALARYEREEPGTALGNTLSNLGNALHRKAEVETEPERRDSLTERSRAYHLRSLRVRKEIGDQRGEANALNNLAAHLLQRASWTTGNTERLTLMREAEDLYRQSATLAEAVQDRAALASTWANLAEVHLRQDRPAEALPFAERALELGRAIGNARSIAKASEKLYLAYKVLGRRSEALTMYELYTTMQDSVRNEENTRLMIRQQYAYEYANRESMLLLEQEKKDAVATEELRRKNVQRNAFIGGFGFMVLLAAMFLFQRNRISKEKARSEALLLNILPHEVAEELKTKGHADAKHFDNVTILFTDFKGFTEASEKMSPQELVEELNICFKAFDNIITARGIEKIKTIGDAYMCAGGLPDPRSSSPSDVVHAAMEMQAFMKQRKAERDGQRLPAFEMRVGIHTGPVVAGIVGVKKFSYDIWGDTVNTASRLESSGAVGQVNISEATYELVKGISDFNFDPRGKVQAKGKGEIEMYFVDGS